MAKLKNTNINDTGFFSIPSFTETTKPSEPVPETIFFNQDKKIFEKFNNTYNTWIPIDVNLGEASGGNTTEDINVGNATYRVHYFTSVGISTFVVTEESLMDFVIVAGGGGGGSGAYGGGGGGGGVVIYTEIIKPGSYTVEVGSGGSGSSNVEVPGQNGGDSSVFGYLAVGGGGGGPRTRDRARPGGSGGGGATPGDRGGLAILTSHSFGNAGASNFDNDGGTYGAGGGGAGGPGLPAPGLYDNGSQDDSLGGKGGAGISSNITGNLEFYAGGGGGGARSGYTNPIGGVGGGGKGGQGSGDQGDNGMPNTGGGGGGAGQGNGQRGGDGGSGIVIIRYRIG